MIDLITDAFLNIEDCLTKIIDKHSYVFEDDNLKKGIFVSTKEISHLHIENKSKHAYYFLQNDDCVMKNVKGGQCDYVIFNSSDLYFVDVKNAKGNFSNHRNAAYVQIENTYKYYSNKLQFPANCVLFGIVCFPSKARIVKASQSSKRKEFKEKYKIDLQLRNYIAFE